MPSLHHRLATIASITLAPLALATVGGYYNSPSDCSITVTNMPDFDQTRTAASGILGLPNDGSMYCVPTSALNLCAYMATHGYAGTSPGDANWKSSANYNAVSLNLAFMGSHMMTDPINGTGAIEGRDGLEVYLANPYAFDVDVYYLTTTYAPNIVTVAQVLANGGLASLCYGRWFHSGNIVTSRSGGHCVTPTHVKLNGASFNLRYRDPATGGPTPFAQSEWLDTSVAGTTSTYFFDGDPFSMTPLGSSSGQLLMIDSVFAVYPFAGLTDDPIGAFVLKPNTFSPYLPDASKHINTGALGQLADLKLMPDNTGIVALTRPVIGGPPGRVKIIDPITDAPSELASLALTNPKASAFNRHQELYIIDGRQLICISVKNNPPTHTSVVLPSDDYNAIACDDDQVLVLKPGPGADILIYPRSLVGTPMAKSLPANIPLSGKTWFDCCTDTKSLWLCSEANENLYEAVIDPASGRYILGDTISSPSIVNPRCIKLRLCDQLIFACDGSVKEYRKLASLWQPQASPFPGKAPGQCFDLSRSNTNHDPAIHPPAEWDFNVDPNLLLPASEVPSCLGDMDFDQDVDLADLQLFLFEFGALGRWRNGDMDQDGTVDLDDLQTFLFNFGRNC